jgi:hypothetical protein
LYSQRLGVEIVVGITATDPLVWMVVEVVRFMLATGLPDFGGGHEVVVLMTQISLRSEAAGVLGLTVTVLRAVAFQVGEPGFVVDAAAGFTTFVLSFGVFLHTLSS